MVEKPISTMDEVFKAACQALGASTYSCYAQQEAVVLKQHALLMAIESRRWSCSINHSPPAVGDKQP